MHSHKAHSVYEIGGEVPETRLTIQTAYIINICEYDFYQRLMLFDKPIIYPYSLVVMRWYLGTATDIGSTITYTILKVNVEYFCRTTVHPLIITGLASPDKKEKWKDFEASVSEALGPCAIIYDFDANDLTPELENYVDNED